MTSSSSDYRPAYLDHFDKNPKPVNLPSNLKSESQPASESKVQQLQDVQPTAAASAAPAPVESTQEQAVFQRQFDQVTINW